MLNSDCKDNLNIHDTNLPGSFSFFPFHEFEIFQTIEMNPDFSRPLITQ